jgi:hypothetical protein
MPSFADNVKPNEAWDLVHFLRTLQVGRPSPENNVLKAAGGRSILAPATEQQPPAAAPEKKGSGGN